MSLDGRLGRGMQHLQEAIISNKGADSKVSTADTEQLRNVQDSVQFLEESGRKAGQHVQGLTNRVDGLEQAKDELREEMFVLCSRVDALGGPGSGVKSRVTMDMDNSHSLYPNVVSRDVLEEIQDEDLVSIASLHEEVEMTAEGFERLKEHIKTLLRNQIRLKSRNKYLNSKIRELSYNSEVRLRVLEQWIGLFAKDRFHADYADHLDKAGFYFADAMDQYAFRDRPQPEFWSKEPRLRPPPPQAVAEATGLVHGDRGDNSSSNRARNSLSTPSNDGSMADPSRSAPNTSSSQGHTTQSARLMNTTSASGLPTIPSEANVPEDALPIMAGPVDEFTWHTPKADSGDLLPAERFTRIAFETSVLRPKFLYGVFIKLRLVRNIKEVASRPGAIPIVEPLPAAVADMTAFNKVLLLEWQTNRAKKLNGVQRLKFDTVPVIPEGTDGPGHGGFFLEEREPIRVIQDRQPIRLMQYETSFGPTRRRLLKVAHVTLDNRRKYHIVCPSEFWPVYEIWEMNGPLPVKDRHVLVFRSPESPVAVTGSLAPSPSMIPAGDDVDAYEQDDGEFEAYHGGRLEFDSPYFAHAHSVPVEAMPQPMSMGAVPMSQAFGPPTQTGPAGRRSPPSSAEFLGMDPNPGYSNFDDGTSLKNFAQYFAGRVTLTVQKSGTSFNATLTVSLRLPSLSTDNRTTEQHLNVSHSHSSEQVASLGAQHTALGQIRREFHVYWTMFVLEPVAFSESYCQFLQNHLPSRTPSERIRKWFEMRQVAPDKYQCRVKYGDGMKLSESAENADPNLAREEASYLAMAQVQEKYPDHFLTVRPTSVSGTEAMESYLKIHSAHNEDMFVEKQSGTNRQWCFREFVLAEGASQQIATQIVLDSMELISRSRIQKFLTISQRFEMILRGVSSSPKSETAVDDETDAGYRLPTRANMRQLNLQNKQPTSTYSALPVVRPHRSGGGDDWPESAPAGLGGLGFAGAGAVFGPPGVGVGLGVGMSMDRERKTPTMSPVVAATAGRGTQLRSNAAPFVFAPGAAAAASVASELPGSGPAALANPPSSGQMTGGGLAPMSITGLTGTGTSVPSSGTMPMSISTSGLSLPRTGSTIAPASAPQSRSGPGWTNAQVVTDSSAASSSNAGPLPAGAAVATLAGSRHVSQMSNLSNSGMMSTGTTTALGMAMSVSSSESKMNPEAAFAIFEAIGVSPLAIEQKAGDAVTRIFHYAQTYAKAVKMEDVFSFEKDKNNNWVCTVSLGKERIAQGQSNLRRPASIRLDEGFDNTARKAAHDAAVRKALPALQSSDQHYKHFLVKIPLDTENSPTSTLLQFFQMHSIYKQGDELQGVYRSYMHATNTQTAPTFECKLTFKGTELGQGQGDTKRRAREEASRKVLKRLGEAQLMLDKESAARLDRQFRRADAPLPPPPSPPPPPAPIGPPITVLEPDLAPADNLTAPLLEGTAADTEASETSFFEALDKGHFLWQSERVDVPLAPPPRIPRPPSPSNAGAEPDSVCEHAFHGSEGGNRPCVHVLAVVRAGNGGVLQTAGRLANGACLSHSHLTWPPDCPSMCTWPPDCPSMCTMEALPNAKLQSAIELSHRLFLADSVVVCSAMGCQSVNDQASFWCSVLSRLRPRSGVSALLAVTHVEFAKLVCPRQAGGIEWEFSSCPPP